MRELKIFSGRANQPLAEDICGFLHLSLGAVTLTSFPDGENHCKIEEDVRGRDVFLVQSTCPPVNDNLMELLIMIDSSSEPVPLALQLSFPISATHAPTARMKGESPLPPSYVLT